jgi:starch phosphorylase
MKDLNMQQAVGLQLEQVFRQDFDLNRQLPENLLALEEISKNYYWSWQADGVSLFRDLDAKLWEKCEQNPRLLLNKISDLRLWQVANDANYLSRLQDFIDQQTEYLSEKTKKIGRASAEKPIAYFCAEYGVHNSLPIYSGGLGILAGDHLKSASDMNVPLVAIGLMYRFGYFRQQLDSIGFQTENYLDSFDNEMALTPVLDENGKRLTVKIHMRGREVFAQCWLAKIGRISLYLLDSNVPMNADVDKLVTGHLYGGDRETRIVQEKLLGIGGVRLLRKLGISPSVYHLNEGHSAFLTLELAHEIVQKEKISFEKAAKKVKEMCVFTTHTPVPAGNDVFSPEMLIDSFSASYIEELGLTREQFFDFGRSDENDKLEWFGMSPLAIKMSRSTNGVSEKHGEVSREMWQKMFPSVEVKDVPITHITNGVHAPTWIAPAFQSLYETHIGKDWTKTLESEKAWTNAVNKIPDEEIWNTHLNLKQQLIAFIRERKQNDSLFDKDILTIGFARRVAGYKRWNLLLHDIERLAKIIDKPVQFVFAGKAHPQDNKAKLLLQNLLSEALSSRITFIEDYDQEVARYLVQGVDVWMNVPRRPLEASGTSGQKVSMNGGLNFSILDGWWIEGYNGINGFGINGLGENDNQFSEEEIDEQDANLLYETLENEIAPCFYHKDENNLPSKWIARMRNSLQTLTYQFSSDRMLRDYLQKIYK